MNRFLPVCSRLRLCWRKPRSLDPASVLRPPSSVPCPKRRRGLLHATPGPHPNAPGSSPPGPSGSAGMPFLTSLTRCPHLGPNPAGLVESSRCVVPGLPGGTTTGYHLPTLRVGFRFSRQNVQTPGQALGVRMRPGNWVRLVGKGIPALPDGPGSDEPGAPGLWPGVACNKPLLRLGQGGRMAEDGGR